MGFRGYLVSGVWRWLRSVGVCCYCVWGGTWGAVALKNCGFLVLWRVDIIYCFWVWGLILNGFVGLGTWFRGLGCLGAVGFCAC